MSLSRLTAGTGYRYLLRHTACGDAARDPGADLSAYYANSGNPPGRWLGTGLAGLGAGRGLPPGTAVTEKAMSRMFGSGHDPVAAAALGRPYPVFRPVAERVAEKADRLPGTLAETERAATIAAIESAEAAKPRREAVAGFDLTFTAPKSASILWALGDPHVHQAVAAAHRDAVTATLGVLEERYLHTRTGRHSCVQVATRGLIAAAFDHFDSRTGDPNLHTHVVIANKVQGPDGGWRSLDSKDLHAAAVALSEVYDVLMADAVAARLPVLWGHRSRGQRRSPAFEIEGLPNAVLSAFSERSLQIEEAMPGLLATFRGNHDREPTRREVLRLRQQATLATRPAKTVRSLADLRERWQTKGSALTGAAPDRIVALAHATPRAQQRPVADDVPGEVVEQLAEMTLAAAGQRRSTWTRPNLLAEAARATRTLRVRTAADRLALLDQVVDEAITKCVPLDPPEMFTAPTRFTRPDGASAFTRPDEHAYATHDVLDAETRLQAATDTTDAPAIPDGLVAAAFADTSGLRGSLTGRRLTTDQQAAVATIATSARRVDVLVGPAGTGKTRTLHALRHVWEAAHGQGSVIGLAPSATAAAELGLALGIPTENVAKWLHETGRQRPPVSAIDHARTWELRAGQLLIVDEASMIATRDLDTLVTQASRVGAKVALVGDHHQLSAVGAGGGFALLADQPQAVHLEALWRFQHRWEAQATRGLRAGNPAALDAYARHERLHDGPSELMRDRAYDAWATDLAAGRSALLLAADRATATALNARARADRVHAGFVAPAGVPLSDDTAAGRGDVIGTRRNARHLKTSDGHVRNGDLWTVTAAHDDGSLDVTAQPRPGQHRPAAPEPVHLPAGYVREHVELGYAATIHRAQGMTVDRAHVLTGPGMTRQALYVAMTRGRNANHAYVVTDHPADDCHAQSGPAPPTTGRQALERVLATDGGELSATATLRQRQDQVTSPGRLLPIRETLTASQDSAGAASTSDAASADGGEAQRAVDQIDALIRLRRSALRQQPPRPFSSPPTTNTPRHNGISR